MRNVVSTDEWKGMQVVPNKCQLSSSKLDHSANTSFRKLILLTPVEIGLDPSHPNAEISAAKNASPIWKSIEKAKSIVSKGACCLIGDGKFVDTWLDPWVSWIQGFTPAPKSASTPSGLKLYPNGLQAETEALLWAVQLASRERWFSVTFEGDSKVCLDGVLKHKGSPDWFIENLIYDIILAAESFPACSFAWVNRSCNNVAHVAAKFAIESNMSCFFISGNLPPSIVDACKKDAPLCFSVY
ncbi:hypothetical protein SO802_016175 [Lithocarpus litseifolius]|uniref:RNase H type-1 domain-containing protein n=1 Tax=Lithocarpus litseifolius TaxID=425828 RepID=A0AAW2CY96_9ROSI